MGGLKKRRRTAEVRKKSGGEERSAVHAAPLQGGLEGREEGTGVKERKRETCERMTTRKQRRKERKLK